MQQRNASRWDTVNSSATSAGPLSPLKGQPVRLEFFLKQARLYAFAL